jgi:hypothetical protein
MAFALKEEERKGAGSHNLFYARENKHRKIPHIFFIIVIFLQLVKTRQSIRAQTCNFRVPPSAEG